MLRGISGEMRISQHYEYSFIFLEGLRLYVHFGVYIFLPYFFDPYLIT